MPHNGNGQWWKCCFTWPCSWCRLSPTTQNRKVFLLKKKSCKIHSDDVVELLAWRNMNTIITLLEVKTEIGLSIFITPVIKGHISVYMHLFSRANLLNILTTSLSSSLLFLLTNFSAASDYFMHFQTLRASLPWKLIWMLQQKRSKLSDLRVHLLAHTQTTDRMDEAD